MSDQVAAVRPVIEFDAATINTAIELYSRIKEAIEKWGITEQTVLLISADVHESVPEIKLFNTAGALEKITLILTGLEVLKNH